MEPLVQKTFTAFRSPNDSLTYNYYITEAPASSTGPTLLLLHGWPDSAYLWTSIIPSLLQINHRILALDTLGTGATSQPTDIAAYNWKSVCNDLIELLLSEGIKSCIPIGHDWGSSLGQHLYLYHRDMVEGLVLVNVPYLPPSPNPFDLEAANAMTIKLFGYPTGAYWEMQLAEDAPVVMQQNAERLWEAMHGDEEGLMKKIWCTPGALRAYLTGELPRVELKEYAKDEARKGEFLERMAKYGINGQLNMYRAVAGNVHFETEKELASDKEKLVLKVPVLYIGCTEDAVGRIELHEFPKKAGLLPDCREVILECGHWSPMEKPQEISDAVTKFLKERF